MSKLILTDQYGNNVDTSKLVLLPDVSRFQPAIGNPDYNGIHKVEAADWYEVNGVLMAYAEEINTIRMLSEDDPADAGVKFEIDTEIKHIPPLLHRFSFKDGFYHA